MRSSCNPILLLTLLAVGACGGLQPAQREDPDAKRDDEHAAAVEPRQALAQGSQPVAKARDGAAPSPIQEVATTQGHAPGPATSAPALAAPATKAGPATAPAAEEEAPSPPQASKKDQDRRQADMAALADMLGERMDTSSAPSPRAARPKSESKPRPKRRALAIRSGNTSLGTLGHGAGGGSGYGRAAELQAPRPSGAPLRQVEPAPGFNTEAYAHEPENDFNHVADKPLSTFSIDVDTAAYANVRRFLQSGQPPPSAAVRVEEMINYFSYDYPAPKGDEPFSVHTEVASAPWNPAHRLVHIGLKGREIDQADTPARNLVFLLDVSGSMQSPDKLPLLKQGMAMLTHNLRPQDRVAIVVYAGASGLVLPSTGGDERGTILAALDKLHAGGSTNGADGIELAYRVASANFQRGGINRVVLATDGDFNVGVTSQGALVDLIEDKRKSGVFLTVLGFGRGNLKDSTMERLADTGNGNYAYIDSQAEAHKVLVREAGSTLVTIAKDAKLQVEFNPALVSSYRLIGYENRRLAARDFNDDSKDAGEIGAGHTVTALYEVVPRAASKGAPEVDPLRYQRDRALTAAAESDELATVKLRYKQPDGHRSRLLAHAIRDGGRTLAKSSRDFRFAAAVAGFAMVLQGSPHRGKLGLPALSKLARAGLGRDPHGDRNQLLELMAQARQLGIR